MAQQTAVEWLYEQIQNGNITSEKTDCGYFVMIKDNCLEQAREIMKEQIMKAVDRGYDEGCRFPEDMTLKNAEQYYNETYGNTNSN